jgi:hypothetical protein
MEENFNEALKNAHKCFQYETDAIRDPLKDILDDPKIEDPSATSNFWLLASALHRFFKAT